MQWIFLIGDEELTLKKMYNITYEGGYRKSYVDSDRFFVDYGTEHIFYEYMPAPEMIEEYEYELEELEQLKKIPFKKLHFIMMTYSSEEIMKSVLREKNFPKDIYIDNEHGSILPISEFINSY